MAAFFLGAAFLVVVFLAAFLTVPVFFLVLFLAAAPLVLLFFTPVLAFAAFFFLATCSSSEKNVARSVPAFQHGRPLSESHPKTKQLPVLGTPRKLSAIVASTSEAIS